MRILRASTVGCVGALVVTSLVLGACGSGTDDDESLPQVATTVPAADVASVPRPDTLDEPVEASKPADRTDDVEILPETTWQWQLQGDIDTGYDVDLYDIDLFDTPRSVIDGLHAEGRIVVCYYSAGSFEEWRDDAAAYPADVLGEALDGWEGERWIDTRSEVVRSIIEDRHDIAVEKGCDGVEPDNVTAFQNDSGFELSAADQLDFNRFLATSAHERGLLVALKNDLDQIPDLVDHFDFAVNEECIEFDECDAYAPFVEAGKAVLNAEYARRFVDDPSAACEVASAVGIRTLVLPLELDDSFRIAC